jgi:ATP-dependent HslUV protease subunit HslV
MTKHTRVHVFLPLLQATMIVADATTCLEVSGRGELLEPADGVHAIGSGSRFAIAAARALMTVPGLQPLDIAQRAMRIAAEKCVYTNSNFIWGCIGQDGQLQSGSSSGGSGGSSQDNTITQKQQQQ